MHAIVCHTHGDPSVMRYLEVPQPRPNSDEVVIRAEAIGVNYVDTMRRSGRHPAAPATPFTPGIEVSGTVAEVGERVTGFREGDRVIGRCVTHGTYAEYVCVQQRFTVACPPSMSAQEGAAVFVTGQTAYHALVTVGQVKPGETVLITAAAGGVGTVAVQIAKALGTHVLAAVGSPEKFNIPKSLGADAVFDYTEREWPLQALDATNGRGADLIVDSVGGLVSAFCQQCWAQSGRLVVYGQASGHPAQISGDDLLFGNRSVHGLAVGTVIEDEAVMRSAMDRLGEWLADGKLRVTIGGVYPLSEARQAHTDLENRATTGKLVLIPD